MSVQVMTGDRTALAGSGNLAWTSVRPATATSFSSAGGSSRQAARGNNSKEEVQL
jgi:hypothetical protein